MSLRTITPRDSINLSRAEGMNYPRKWDFLRYKEKRRKSGEFTTDL